MGRKTAELTPSVDHVLRGLGENIRLARLRRKIPATMLAERAGMTRNTLRAIERGEGGVTVGAYASVLFCLGLENDLQRVAQDDQLGRKLQDAGLSTPKKRVARTSKVHKGQ
jgi:transcriptional regulator with XRE-family HTH domain